MRSWSGAGVSVLVCTQGAAIEVVLGVSVDTTILHTFLTAPACTACSAIIYSKELERDVTTSVMANAIQRLKTLVFIPS